MNIDELILKLSRIRAERGNLTVLVYDGMDPSDLEAINRIETSPQTFFTPAGRVEQEAVLLLT